METLTRIAIALGACGVVFVIMTGIWYLAHLQRQRQRRAYIASLSAERPNAGREQFVAWFVDRGVRQSVAETVYDELQRHSAVPDFPLAPDDPLERVCDIVVHEEIDDLLQAMGYGDLEDSEWGALDWETLDLPPPSEPDAPIASLVYLVNSLQERRISAPDTSAGGAL